MLSSVIVRLFGSIWTLKRYCLETKIPTIKKLLIWLYGIYQRNNNSSIAWNSEFLGIPCLPHGIKSIFISGGAKIGKNCVILQQVTIGSNLFPDSKRIGAPIIGNNCFIGAGAKIVGRVVIGDNVRIGANAVVYKNVPANSIVTTGEQTVVKMKNPLDNKFYSYHGKWVYYCNNRWLTVDDEQILVKLNKVKPEKL